MGRTMPSGETVGVKQNTSSLVWLVGLGTVIAAAFWWPAAMRVGSAQVAASPGVSHGDAGGLNAFDRALLADSGTATLAGAAGTEPAFPRIGRLCIGETLVQVRKDYPGLAYLYPSHIAGVHEWRCSSSFSVSVRGKHVVAITSTAPDVSVYGIAIGDFASKSLELLGEPSVIGVAHHSTTRLSYKYPDRNVEFAFAGRPARVASITVRAPRE